MFQDLHDIRRLHLEEDFNDLRKSDPYDHVLKEGNRHLFFCRRNDQGFSVRKTHALEEKDRVSLWFKIESPGNRGK